MITEERLQKYMARCGVASRRQCEQLIQAGQVSVNGRVVTTLGTKVIPRKDRVQVKGALITVPSSHLTIMLHKPKDTITTKNDPRGRKTVYDCLPADLSRNVFAVGRLDRNTTGLLLLTSDGELANHLTQPHHAISKIYRVTIKGKLSLSDLQKLQNGVQLGTRLTRPARVEILEINQGQTCCLFELNEGMYRQIRRMVASVGSEVIKLKRIAMGRLKLGKLPPRQYRTLTKEEIKRVKQ